MPGARLSYTVVLVKGPPSNEYSKVPLPPAASTVKLPSAALKQLTNSTSVMTHIGALGAFTMAAHSVVHPLASLTIIE